ncbi:MAG: hypothetical protein DMF70_01165, partial [Acidobacteria bacterium]
SSGARPNPSETNSSFFLRQKAIETPIKQELTWIVTESGASPQKRSAAEGQLSSEFNVYVADF